jgi:2-oxoglutarate dehydrogenase E1 component
VHVVINNQVGFTISAPDDARSTWYCTDVAKTSARRCSTSTATIPRRCCSAPHSRSSSASVQRDVVIDLVCYRRHGHNEADEPAATQPLMYQAIRARKTTRELYAERLQAKASTRRGATAHRRRYRAALEPATPSTRPRPAHRDARRLEPLRPRQLDQSIETAIERKQLARLAKTINAVPSDFTAASARGKVYEDRVRCGRHACRSTGLRREPRVRIDGAEGFRLRLFGQDSGRGTFFPATP